MYESVRLNYLAINELKGKKFLFIKVIDNNKDKNKTDEKCRH